jgi:hypothetical protein
MVLRVFSAVHRLARFFFAIALIAAFIVSAAHAQSACSAPALTHQRRDAATIQRLEKAWSVAYLKGDLDFERCLLTPDFTEIMRTGEVKVLADELDFARKNIGKNLPIPDLPAGSVFIHANVAVAYGLSSPTAPDGTVRKTRYADYYVWQKDGWHAFFAQQTALPN